jgi:hypothetical protein
MHRELSAKRLEMLRAAFPHVSTVAVLLNPHGPAAVTKFDATEEGARWI